MNEDEWQKHARVAALELLVAHTYNLATRLVGANEATILSAEQSALASALEQPLPKAPADLSQHFAAEVQLELERLFAIARDQRQAAGA